MEPTPTLAALFTRRQFVVPPYQRGYAWGKDQVGDFLQDLELLPSDRDHYTGTMVLHPQPESTWRTDITGERLQLVHVVDGQQRLTTIVLLLDALRRKLESVRPHVAQAIRDRFLWTTDDDDARLYRLRLGDDVQPYWESHILAVTEAPGGASIQSHARLAAARDQLRTWLDDKATALGERSVDALLDLHHKLTGRLRFTVHEVGSMTDVGVVFEVMNNRGKPLSELEKAKNHFLWVAANLDISPENREALADLVNDTWSRILRRLMAAGLVRTADEDQLLRTHWLAAYDHDERHWEGSRTLRTQFDPRLRRTQPDGDKVLRGRIEAYLRTLDACTVAFCDAWLPAHPGAFDGFGDTALRAEIGRWSQKLLNVGVVAPFLPLLVAARVKGASPEPYLRVVKACERFAFRVYRLEEKRAHAGKSGLLWIGHHVWRGDRSVAQACEYLDQHLQNYQTEAMLAGICDPSEPDDWYNWSGLRYMLFEYEEHLAGDRPRKLSWFDLTKRRFNETIEHILPQTPSAAWRHFPKKIHEEVVHDLGNLVLTRDNSVYLNRGFEQKRGTQDSAQPCYAKSDLRQELELATLSEWTVSSIEARRARLLAWVRTRWSATMSAPNTEPLPTDVDDDTDELDEAHPQSRSEDDSAE